MSNITTIARTAATTLVVLGLSAGVAVANPCETDAAFAAANDCATPPALVVPASLDASSSAATMAPGLGLRVR
jgi:hypothetical protein